MKEKVWKRQYLVNFFQAVAELPHAENPHLEDRYGTKEADKTSSGGVEQDTAEGGTIHPPQGATRNGSDGCCSGGAVHEG
eukprot:923627-Prorocentrum_minimum.AAC.2